MARLLFPTPKRRCGLVVSSAKFKMNASASRSLSCVDYLSSDFCLVQNVGANLQSASVSSAHLLPDSLTKVVVPSVSEDDVELSRVISKLVSWGRSGTPKCCFV